MIRAGDVDGACIIRSSSFKLCLGRQMPKTCEEGHVYIWPTPPLYKIRIKVVELSVP